MFLSGNMIYCIWIVKKLITVQHTQSKHMQMWRYVHTLTWILGKYMCTQRQRGICTYSGPFDRVTKPLC